MTPHLSSNAVLSLYCLPLLIYLLILPFSNANVNNTHLADGFLVTRTPVREQANIALDIRDMIIALEADDFDTARSIYENGKHSTKLNSKGENKGLRPLQEMSLKSYYKFLRNPTFNIHIYGLNGDIENATALQYADNFVQYALNDPNSGTLAAEASVALNLWMYVTHELWDNVYDCRTEEAALAADEIVDGLEDNEGIGVHAIDEAMAYWIGIDQEISPTGTGYALYKLAQQAESDFQVRMENAVPLANSQLKMLYEESRTLIAADNRCHPGSNTWQELYHITNEMVTYMTIPLMQKLIHSIMTEDMYRIRLYAIALLPQIAGCKPSTHRYLMSKLYYSNYLVEDRMSILTALQSTYDCLGFTCEDIGAYRTNVIPQCADRPGDAGFAGYRPSTDHYQHSKIDLDILQIRILTRMEAWPTARLLYELGKNSVVNKKKRKYRTLSSMATSRTRTTVVPFYEMFATYNEDQDYADTTIGDALSAIGRFGTMSDTQQDEFVSKTLSFQVVYMYALEEMFRALSACRDIIENVNSTETVTDVQGYWDKGVALLVGSIEGIEGGGADAGDGVMFVGLANERCQQFGTCRDDTGRAQILEDFVNVFDEGVVAINDGDCESVEKSIYKVAHLMMVPVMQSVIRYAMINEKLPVYSENSALAKGDALAMSVVPIIDFYDAQAADVIEMNMRMQLKVNPVNDGAQAVADALREVVENFYVTCEALGSAEGISVCDEESTSGGVKVWRDGMVVELAVGIWIMSMLFYF